MQFYQDNRGCLHSLKELPFYPKEVLVSESKQNVLRGLHQSPYRKMIYISKGKFVDFYVLNGKMEINTLVKGQSLLIPANAAHGFFAEEDSEMIYLLEDKFDAAKDLNLNWKSPEVVGLPAWKNIIISDKDRDSVYIKPYDYLVLGGSGFLGRNCVKHLQEQGKSVFVSTARLENYAAIEDEIKKSRCKYVICAAGIGGRPTIDWCDSHEEETYKTNFLDVLNVVEICKRCNVHLTYFGSGTVFSGNKPSYTEEDVKDFAQNKVYCKLRMLLEDAIKGKKNFLYLRIMYPSTFDGDVKCFYQKMLGRRGKVHAAQVSITSVPDLFPKLPELIEKGEEGIYNFVCEGTISLRDFIKDDSPISSETPRGNYELKVDKLKGKISVANINDVMKRIEERESKKAKLA